MAEITLTDLSLSHIRIAEGEPLDTQRDAYFKTVPEICIERPRLITKYHLDHGLFEKEWISILDKAKAYRYALERREPVVRHTTGYEKHNKEFPFRKTTLEEFHFKDTSPFAGSTTSKFKGVPLYPELMGLAMWPELHTVSNRTSNPFQITSQQAEELNLHIFPHWMNHSITEVTRSRHYADADEDSAMDDMKLLQHLVFILVGKPVCISHTIPDFSRAVNLGLDKMIEDAADRRAAAGDESQHEFYSAIIEVLEGIITYSTRLADKARDLAEREHDSEERDKLLEIARIYRRVPAQPAQTFREGLTTIWICWTAIHLENPNTGLSLGRLDQILYDLYRKDIDGGRLTVEEAAELLCYFWLKIGDHVPAMPEAAEQLFGGTGSNQAITIGGVDRYGKDAVNDLTYVILRTVEIMKLRDPNLNARYYPGKNPQSYLKRLCEVNISTAATPAIHNDKAVIEALAEITENEEWRRDYGIVGCVEPVSSGRHYAHCAAVGVNVAAAVELAIYSGKHRLTGLKPSDPQIGPQTGNPAGFKDFGEFWDAFEQQTRHLIDRLVTLNNRLGKAHQDFCPTPILSAFFEGPMESGKDLVQGGAEINSSGATIIGFADAVDSLNAIKKWLFDDKRLSFSDLRDALNHDFDSKKTYYDKFDKMTKNYSALQKLLSNVEKTPKFGDGNAATNGNATKMVTMLHEAFGRKLNYRGGPYLVGYWTMTFHAGFGNLTGALPNGRWARENFASGITPVSMVTPNLTGMLNSVAELPARCLSGGIALNIKFTPNDGSHDTMLDNFADTVNAYFSKGGMEIQFNIWRHEDLVEAARLAADDPALQNMLVRVSGYTAYFKDLNPRMQKEIIDRTEYLVSTGQMQFFKPFPLNGKRWVRPKSMIGRISGGDRLTFL
jgi:pyruvate-formate lyase